MFKWNQAIQGMQQGTPMYALGVQDTDDNLPTASRSLPALLDKSTEVTSFSGWPFYIAESSLTLNTYSVKPEPVPDEIDYDDLLEQAELQKKPAVSHDKPAPTIQYDSKVDFPDHIKVDNLVDIPEEELQAVVERSKQLTDDVTNIILNEGAASLLSFDSASSYSEAALTDGLGIVGKIDSTIPEALSQILKLSVICKYVDNTSIPESYRHMFLSRVTRLLAEKSCELMDKKATQEHKSALIKAAAGVQGRVSKQSKSEPSKPPRPGYGQGASARRFVSQPIMEDQ